jgi:hypothetical protein
MTQFCRAAEAEAKLARALTQMDRSAGVDAESLAKRLVDAGLHQSDAQQAIQSALDRGSLRLGAQLRLYGDEGVPPSKETAV